MSDEEHHFEAKGDVGASKTFPQQAGTIRKNGYIVIKNRPCKVVEVSTSKTGKHGHAKCHFVGIDIFTGKKLEDIVPSSHNCDVPHVNRTDYQLIDISEDGFVSLLTDSGGTKDDLMLPTDENLLTQCPGDVVLDLSTMTNQTIKLGGGLRQDCDAISVTKAGRLRFSKPNKYWVESSQKRYVPHVEDSVLGIVVDSRSDNFHVDIKGPALAFLPVLAFEGGTRRNIPKFEAGTLIYARVVKANPGMNPELSCTDDTGKAAEFGALKDGYMFECSTGLSRMLLSSPTCPVLETLGKKLSFEIAVGLNGRVWVNSSSPSTTIIVANAIMNSESLSGVQQKIMVEKLLQRI